MPVNKYVKSQDGGVGLLPNKKTSYITIVGFTGRMYTEYGSVYLSYPLMLDNVMTECSIVIESHVTLLVKPRNSQKRSFDRYKVYLSESTTPTMWVLGIGIDDTIHGSGQIRWWNFMHGTGPCRNSKNIVLHKITTMDSTFQHLDMFEIDFEIYHIQILLHGHSATIGSLKNKSKMKNVTLSRLPTSSCRESTKVQDSKYDAIRQTGSSTTLRTYENLVLR